MFNSKSFSNMSKYIKSIFVCTMLLTSCHGILDQEPKINFSPENYFSTEQELLTGLTAVYDPLSSGGGRNTMYWAGAVLLLDFLTDDVLSASGSGSLNEADRVELTDNNGFVRRFYQGLFEIINRANLVMENIPNVSLPSERALRYEAECRFLRAYAYYNLSSLYGEVPLRTNAIRAFEDGPIAKSPVSDIYEIIDQDLLFAAQHLPWTYGAADLGRANRGAALMLHAKSYMFRQDFSSALPLIEQVVQSGEYSLIENYADVFSVENKNHPEHIFSARFGGGLEGRGEGGILEERYSPPPSQAPDGFIPGRSNAIAVPTNTGVNTNLSGGLINEYIANDDPRLDHVYVNFSDDPEAPAYYCDKFRDESEHISRNASTNYPLFRYSDALLMYAECLNEVNAGPNAQAFEAINQVRRRANNAAPEGKSLPDLSGLNAQQFRDAIYLERRLELSHEGHRWIDLLRTDRMQTTMSGHLSRAVEPFRRLFPIPNRELDANPAMTQNEGY